MAYWKPIAMDPVVDKEDLRPYLVPHLSPAAPEQFERKLPLNDDIRDGENNDLRSGKVDDTKGNNIGVLSFSSSHIPQTPTKISKRTVAEYNTPFTPSPRNLSSSAGLTGTAASTRSLLSSQVNNPNNNTHQHSHSATLRFQTTQTLQSQTRSNSLQSVHNYFNSASALSPSKEGRMSSLTSSSQPSKKFQYIYKSVPSSQSLGLPVALSGSSQSLSQLHPLFSSQLPPAETDSSSTKSNASSFVSSSPPHLMNNSNHLPPGSKYLQLPISALQYNPNSNTTPNRAKPSFSIGSTSSSNPLNNVPVSSSGNNNYTNKLSPPESPYNNSLSRAGSFSFLDSEVPSPVTSLRADTRSANITGNSNYVSAISDTKSLPMKDRRVLEKLESLKESITNDLGLKLQKIDYENSILTKELEQKHLNLQNLNKELDTTCTDLRLLLHSLNAKDLSEFKSLEFKKVDDLQTRLNLSRENFNSEKEKLSKFENDLKLLNQYREKGQIDKQKQTRIVFGISLTVLVSIVVYKLLEFFVRL